MQPLHQPAKEGPSASWGPPCASHLNEESDIPRRSASGESEASTAATAAGGASCLLRCPLCHCATAVCFCGAAELAEQRERLRQQQELLHQQRLLLQQQHEQLEMEGSLQRQRKALLQQQLEDTDWVSSLGGPLDVPCDPQESQCAEGGAPKGDGVTQGTSLGPHTPAMHRAFGDPSPCSGELLTSLAQQEGPLGRAAAGREDSKSLEEMLGPRLYTAYKRLESQGLQGPSRCLFSPPAVPPGEAPNAAAATSTDAAPRPAANAAAAAAAAAGGTVSFGKGDTATEGTAATVPLLCARPCLAPLQQPSPPYRVSLCSPDAGIVPAQSGVSDPNTTCSNSASSSSGSSSSERPYSLSTETHATSTADCGELTYYSFGAFDEGGPPRNTPGPLPRQERLNPGSNDLSDVVLFPVCPAAADELERGALRGPPAEGKLNLSRDGSRRGSVGDWGAPSRCDVSSQRGERGAPDSTHPPSVLARGRRNEGGDPGGSSGCPDDPASWRALTATVSELQARLAAAEQQTTHNFLGCLRREVALRQLKQQIRTQSGGLSAPRGPQSAVAKEEASATETLRQTQQKLQVTESEREYLKVALKRKHLIEMGLRARLASLSTLNEQLQAEASTLMSFHRLADAHGQTAAEKLLLQQLRAEAEGQTCKAKELQRLLSTREAEVSTLRTEVAVCRKALGSLAVTLRNIPLGGPKRGPPRPQSESRSTQTDCITPRGAPDIDDLPDSMWRQLTIPAPPRSRQVEAPASERNERPPAFPSVSEGPQTHQRQNSAPHAIGGPSLGGRPLEDLRKSEKGRPATGERGLLASLQQEGVEGTLLGTDDPPARNSAIMRFTIGPSKGYTPKPNDSIDRAVAELSNARINKVLFTRLCKGVYLYGHLAVVIRLGPSGELQVSFEGKDYSAKDFIHSFEDEEFRYLTAKSNDSGSGLSLEVCPSGTETSEGPAVTSRSLAQQPRPQLGKQEAAAASGTKRGPGSSAGRRGPSRRRTAATAAAEAAVASGPPRIVAGRNSSISTYQTAAALSRLQSCRVLPVTPLSSGRSIASGGPYSGTQRREQGGPPLTQRSPSNPQRGTCAGQSRLKAPKLTTATAAPSTIKKRTSRAAVAASPPTSNGPSPLAGTRGATLRHLGRAAPTEAQPQGSCRKASQAKSHSVAPGRRTTLGRTRQGVPANAQTHDPL